MVPLYIVWLGDKDFDAEQGDDYYTMDGFLKRKEYMLNGRNINVFMYDWIIRRMSDFQEEANKAFDEESLKNS